MGGDPVETRDLPVETGGDPTDVRGASVETTDAPAELTGRYGSISLSPLALRVEPHIPASTHGMVTVTGTSGIVEAPASLTLAPRPPSALPPVSDTAATT